MALFSPQPKSIFLMDGSAYLYRSFYGSPPLQRADGFPTGVITVLTKLLFRILKQGQPHWFSFIKDGPGRTFRHELYDEYKANRKSMPTELSMQIEPMQRILQALGIHYQETKGCEADDYIASLAERFSSQYRVVILSGDKDLRQCLGPNVVLWDPNATKTTFWTAEDVKAETGVSVELWADAQALTGDSIDNIPGVPGIGPKTVTQIFEYCPGIDAIRKSFGILPAKFQKKLVAHLDKLQLWRKLTTLSREYCADLTLDDMLLKPVDLGALQQLMQEFELLSLRESAESLAMIEQRMALKNASALPPEEKTEEKTEGEKPSPSLPEQKSVDFSPSPMPMKGIAGKTLLDLSGKQELPKASRREDLPSCEGKRLALILPKRESQLALAVEEEEFVWEGDLESLALWAESAHEIVCADVKELIHNDSVWKKPFLKRIAEGRGLIDLGLITYLVNQGENDYSWDRLAAKAAALQKGDLGPGGLGLALCTTMLERLEKGGQLDLYWNLELPLVPVLAEMEDEGVAIDKEAFSQFLQEVQNELRGLEEKIYELAGGKFNMRSPQQLGELLYGKLGLSAKRKTKSGQASTRQEDLEALSGEHPIIDLILQQRKLEKMRSSFLAPLPEQADEQNRLHTSFNQKGTATGRLASHSPNMQNIPSYGPLGKRMRSCFVAREGHVFVECDYSQIELRMLAQMSGDKALLDAFQRGEDIHSRTAMLVFGKADSENRRDAKVMNFGLIYGMGPQKLAKELHVSVPEAKNFVEKYFEQLPGLKAFYSEVEEEVMRTGKVRTLGGRTRLLPNIFAESRMLAAMAQRQAVNTVLQGSSADLMKEAMIAVWKDPALAELGAHIVLQIHDSLLLEVPEANAEALGAIVRTHMEQAKVAGEEFLIPLAVHCGYGKNWSEAE